MIGYSYQLGIQGATDLEVTAVMSGWRSSKAIPEQRLKSLHEDVAGVVNRNPEDPAAQELLAIADSRLADFAEPSRQEYLSAAAVHFRKALELRPMSPYTWANLAAVEYRLGDTGKTFRSALVRAAELGPHEPEVQATVANFGLAVWDEVDAQTQAAIESSVATGMRRQPREILQIAERRGRLAVACRHAVGTPRQTDSKWLHLCQSTEATS
jgi:hypothetical protein